MGGSVAQEVIALLEEWSAPTMEIMNTCGAIFCAWPFATSLREPAVETAASPSELTASKPDTRGWKRIVLVPQLRQPCGASCCRNPCALNMPATEPLSGRQTAWSGRFRRASFSFSASLSAGRKTNRKGSVHVRAPPVQIVAGVCLMGISLPAMLLSPRS